MADGVVLSPNHFLCPKCYSRGQEDMKSAHSRTLFQCVHHCVSDCTKPWMGTTIMPLFR